MKALIWTKYGSPEVLQLREIEAPVPEEGEVLIKVYAATVTAGDCELRSLKLPFWTRLPLRIYAGWSKPRRIAILGQELAGVAEEIGDRVTRFKPGDTVFAPTYMRMGAHAEYVCLPEAYPQLKPANLSYDEAATIPTGGINGLHLVRKADIQPGQSVVINGAGGSIGTYALQIAKAFGAEVTCVDSKEKLAMLQAIGADHVIDYKREDFTRTGKTYDAILDVVGKSSFSGSLRSLNPNGRYILGNPSLSGMIRGWWISSTTGKKVISELANYQAEDFALLNKLIEAGKIRPVIDRRYPLEQTAEAHRYVEQGLKKGNVVITVGRGSAG